MKLISLSIFIFYCLLGGACTKNTPLEKALVLSGENRKTLETVLEYYKEDSLKQYATRFLIENMIGKGCINYTFKDEKENCYFMDTISSTNILLLEKAIHAVNYQRQPPIADLSVISSSYLIENIDLAFNVWQKYPWCKHLSFKRFCRDILPYRWRQEPLEDWRSYYYKQYCKVADSLAKCNASMEDVVFFFNSQYRKKYIQEASKLPSDLPISIMEYLGGGTCDHLALNCAQVMRSIGIPLNIDIVPFHGKINGGHAYNSFTNEKGKFFFFSPYDRLPERQQWIAPLVERVCYELQSKPAIEINEWNRMLMDKQLKNVTSEYYKTGNLSFPIYTKDSLIYLATYNRGTFKVIAQAQIKKSNVTFDNIACGLLYFPMVECQEGLSPVASPFIFSDQGEIQYVTTNEQSVVINKIKIYDAQKVVKLGCESYILLYWKDGWVPLKEVNSKDSCTLDFGQVPYQSLFLIYGNTYIGRMQRPFFVNKGIPVFY